MAFSCFISFGVYSFIISSGRYLYYIPSSTERNTFFLCPLIGVLHLFVVSIFKGTFFLMCPLYRVQFNLDDDKMGDRFLREKGILRDDFGIGNIQEIALAYLLKLMLRAKAEVDEDVRNFCVIHSDSMLGMIYADEPEYDKAQKENVYRQKRREKTKVVADYFDYLSERLPLDKVSWLDITIYNQEYEFARLRELLLYSMERIGFPEEFSF